MIVCRYEAIVDFFNLSACIASGVSTGNVPCCLIVEGAVRAELVEHIPQLMVFSRESNTIPFSVVKLRVIPILTRALSDVRNQVRFQL